MHFLLNFETKQKEIFFSYFISITKNHWDELFLQFSKKNPNSAYPNFKACFLIGWWASHSKKNWFFNNFIPQVNQENKENEKMCMSFSNFPEEYKDQFVPFFKSKG